MIKKLRKIVALDSEFSRNFFVLLRGTLVSQIIPILLMPVLTRIYSPENFGVFELFLSVSLILGSIANGRYELSVILPDRKEDAWNIIGLGFIISIVFSILLLLIISLFSNGIAGLLNNVEIRFWLFFVPLAVFIQGLFNMITYYNTREKQFKNIATSSVSRSVSRTGSQLIIGAFYQTPAGLIIGQIIGFFAALITLSRKLNLMVMFKKISWKNMKKVGKRYIDFPKFILPSTLANNMAVNMTSILISVIYTVSGVGFYSLANRILGLPGSLIGKSMSNVYQKEAVDQLRKYGNIKEVFLNTLKKLVLISLPIFIIGFLFAEDLFAFVFGEEWRIAGEYAKILIPLIFIRFIVAPVSVSLFVFERQKLSLYWQLGLLALSLLSFAIAWYFHLDIKMFLSLMVSVLFFYYLFFIYILYRLVSGKL